MNPKLRAILLNKFINVINIAINGNFPNGDNWSPVNGTESIGSNVYTLTGNGTSTSARAVGTSVGVKALNKKLFCRCLARVTNSSCTQIRFDIRTSSDAAALIAATQLTPTQNIWYPLYGIVTVDATYMAVGQTELLPYILHSYVDNATENGKIMEIKEVMIIDLVNFSGKEPNAVQINEWFPNWFDGSIQVIAK